MKSDPHKHFHCSIHAEIKFANSSSVREVINSFIDTNKLLDFCKPNESLNLWFNRFDMASFGRAR